jgi:hypothetical protein
MHHISTSGVNRPALRFVVTRNGLVGSMHETVVFMGGRAVVDLPRPSFRHLQKL